MEPKTDYQKELDKILLKLEKENIKPKLLLHACCGPCSSYVIEYLANRFDITIYYYNPNIYPPEEYNRRLNELKNFLPRFPQAVNNNVKLVEEHYNPKEFYDATNVLVEKELQTEKEKGERCRRCYKMRLSKARDYAKNNGFDYFTTTLSISPYKDSKMINEIGKELEPLSPDNPMGTLNFLFSDFKKKSGFLRSTQISREYGLWRQDYCGCVFSKVNKEREIKEKEEQKKAQEQL